MPPAGVTEADVPRLDCGPRRPRSQPEEYRRRPAAGAARRAHRAQRLGEVEPRLRHDLRRGPAPVRRVAVGLRQAVPRADGEAGRRPDRRSVPRDLHRAEDDRQQPAVDRWHRHRDLRLSPAALREHRRAALPELRARDRQPVARAHHRPGDDVSPGRAHQRAGAARSRPEGRVQEGAGGARGARLHESAHRRPVQVARGRPQARPPEEPHDRSRGGPADRAVGHRAAAHRVGGNRPASRRRHRRHQQPRRGRPAVLAQDGVRDLRHQRAGDVAARVLVQLAARRVPGMPGAGRDLGFRSRPRRPRSDASRCRRGP